MQKPGIPAQQMQRTGTRERACGSGTGQNPLAEHAQHAPQPRSIAASRGEAAEKQHMKGGAPCFGRVPQQREAAPKMQMQMQMQMHTKKAAGSGATQG